MFPGILPRRGPRRAHATNLALALQPATHQDDRMMRGVDAARNCRKGFASLPEECSVSDCLRVCGYFVMFFVRQVDVTGIEGT